MEAFNYPEVQPSTSELRRFKNREGAVIKAVQRHLKTWQRVTAEAEIDFSITPVSGLGGKGEYMGRKFKVTSETFGKDQEVFAEIRVTTPHYLSGEEVLVDSYCIGANHQIRGTKSLALIKADEIEDEDHIEYLAICDVLYSLATRNYQSLSA